MNTDDTTHDLDEATPGTPARRVVFVAAAALILLSFFGAYAFAASRPSSGAASCDEAANAAGGAEACASGCCSTGESGPAVTGSALIEGDVQRISVDVSTGAFVPGEIVLVAGVPAEITFGEGQGCLAEVQFEQFGILEDLTSGGAVVRLPALDPGTYEFSCGMRMVFGTLVVR